MSGSREIYTDSELFSFVARDEKKGLELLFKKYFTPLYRFAYTILKREDAAQDVVQEVFLKLWKLRGKVDAELNVKAYLYKAVKNMSLNYLEKENRREIVNEYPENISGGDFNASDGLHAREFQSLIDNAIERLPERCQIIFRLSRFDGLSYKEIASHLEISVKTVENQMGTALKKLKGYLGPYIDKTLMALVTLIFENWY